MNNENKHTPAFPPQFGQDNFGRIVAPITGMSKLEYFSLHLLPFYLNLKNKLGKNGELIFNGKDVMPHEAAIISAEQLLQALDEHNKPEEAKIIE
jgi:hypothetical protein